MTRAKKKHLCPGIWMCCTECTECWHKSEISCAWLGKLAQLNSFMGFHKILLLAYGNKISFVWLFLNREPFLITTHHCVRNVRKNITDSNLKISSRQSETRLRYVCLHGGCVDKPVVGLMPMCITEISLFPFFL